jgi:hypothetical protein
MGKVIGGTKGNMVLEYISGAPVKEQIVERIPDIFDYDELTKYGYSVRSQPALSFRRGQKMDPYLISVIHVVGPFSIPSD